VSNVTENAKRGRNRQDENACGQVDDDDDGDVFAKKFVCVCQLRNRLIRSLKRKLEVNFSLKDELQRIDVSHLALGDAFHT